MLNAELTFAAAADTSMSLFFSFTSALSSPRPSHKPFREQMTGQKETLAAEKISTRSTTSKEIPSEAQRSAAVEKNYK